MLPNVGFLSLKKPRTRGRRIVSWESKWNRQTSAMLQENINCSEKQISRRFRQVLWKVAGKYFSRLHFFQVETRPVNFLLVLKKYKFKESLVPYLSQHWENDCMAPIIKDKKVILTVNEKSLSFIREGYHVKKGEQYLLECSHEEADTRIIFHISKADPHTKILIKASHTDVHVILLDNIHKFTTVQILIGDGNTINSQRICTNCTELTSKLGLSLCLVLPRFHAYNSSDYTDGFFRKGKLRPFHSLGKGIRYQNVFFFIHRWNSCIWWWESRCDTRIHVFDVWTQNFSSVNTAHYEIFQKTYSKKGKEKNFLHSVKGFDSSNTPPCWKSLKQKERKKKMTSE